MINKYEYPSITENRHQGILRVFESSEIPFTVQRVFSVVNAQTGTMRGQHAHKICNQLICCVAGEVKLICEDGIERLEIVITPLSKAVLVPAGIWAEQQYLQDNSVIIVFCDQPYDESDYLRDYDEFLKWKGLNR